MKTFLKIVGGLAVLIVVALVAVFYFTAGMADAANGFFRAVQAKDMAAARSHLSEGFKADTSEAQLERFLSDNALDTYKDSTWSRREVSGGKGELEGTITTANGGTIPLKLTLVKESGAWKLHGITKTASGVQTAGEDDADAAETDDAVETDAPTETDATAGTADTIRDEEPAPLPGPAEQAALLKQTLADFAVSVDAKEMSHFRGSTATVWQEQFALDHFESSFGAVYDAGFDFAAAAARDPVIEPASGLGEHGDLVVSGFFRTDPKLVVKAKYVTEGGIWKPYGFEFDTE